MSTPSRPSLASRISSRFLGKTEKKEEEKKEDTPSSVTTDETTRPSLTSRISSRFLVKPEKKEEEKKEDPPSFTTDEAIGETLSQLISSNLENIPNESLIKLTRQVEFWHSSRGGASNDEVVSLTKRLVNAATWASRHQSTPFHCPHVRFGRTELQIPIITCGGMRLQETWFPDNIPLVSLNHKQVLKSDSQKNFKDVILACIKLGLNHFETARMYGTSELQFVDALVSLMEEGIIKREDFIFQTKVVSAKDRASFEKMFNVSWSRVERLGYIDLFGFHVVSKDCDVQWVLDESDQGCFSLINEYKAAGKIKHVGFSTHGTAENIMTLINSNKFDYVNLHCHYFGSYHAEGTIDSVGGHGNTAAVARAKELDMGVFQISPFDKGGLLYRPTTKVAKAVGVAMTPIAFAALHSWKTMGFHTISVGLGRVSDLDEVLEAARMYSEEGVGVDEALEGAYGRLKALAIEGQGEEWYEKGMLNIPSCLKEITSGVAIGHILWLHNVITSYGMYEFAKYRYSNLETTAWNNKKTFDENIEKMMSGNCGRAYIPSVYLTKALENHYDPATVEKKIAEVHEWLSKDSKAPTSDELVAKGWDTAYNLTVWTDFCGDMNTISISKVLTNTLSRGFIGNNKAERRSSLASANSLRASFASVVE